MVEQSRDAEVLAVKEMESMEEVWDDWLRQDNPYAVGDRKTMRADGGQYLNFIKIVLRKKSYDIALCKAPDRDALSGALIM